MRRLTIAGLLALLLIGLGVSLRFDDEPARIELALCFELRGEIPECRFEIGGQRFAAPLLLVIEEGETARADAPFPGTAVAIQLSRVREEAFFRPDLLLAELRPGSQVAAVWADTHMRLPIGGGVLYRTAFVVLERDAAGERPVLLVGLGAEDPGERFPEWVRGTHALAIPIERPTGAPPLTARISSVSPQLVGDPEDPRSYSERIEIRF
jgi:hypothetical protein